MAVDDRRKDGKSVRLPCVSILKPEGDKVGELRVFIDVAPLYAEAPVEAHAAVRRGGSARPKRGRQEAGKKNPTGNDKRSR